MSDRTSFSTINRTKGRLPRLPFVHMKNAVLGKKYILEVAFVTAQESRKLNLHYRNKNKSANVLSFPFSKQEGQIVIAPETAKKQFKSYEFATSNQFIGFLFIHGLLHLEGYSHGSRMESEEKALSERFLKRQSLRFAYGKKNIRGNRHRNVPSKSNDRRRRAAKRSFRA